MIGIVSRIFEYESYMIDVIVPIYNTYCFLPDLISSLNLQIFSNFHVIFINDGSTDATKDNINSVLETASFSYSVIHQENSGVSSARNAGIAHSHADFLTFIDSDDSITPEHFRDLERCLHSGDIDLAFCGNIKVRENTEVSRTNVFKGGISVEEFLIDCYDQGWSISVFTALYRRRILESRKISFTEQCRYGEDREFLYKYLAACCKIACTNSHTYCYRDHAGQSVKNMLSVKQIEKYYSIVRVMEFVSIQRPEWSRLFSLHFVLPEFSRSIRILYKDRQYLLMRMLVRLPLYQSLLRKNILRYIFSPKILVKIAIAEIRGKIVKRKGNDG